MVSRCLGVVSVQMVSAIKQWSNVSLRFTCPLLKSVVTAVKGERAFVL